MLSDLVEEFLDSRKLVLSSHTVSDYRLTLTRFIGKFRDQELEALRPKDVRAFLLTIPGCRKNQLNAYIGLSAFWTWLIREGRTEAHLIRRVEAPRPDKRSVVPLNREQLSALLLAAGMSRTPLRDRAVVLLLADTGIRATELCDAEVSNYQNGMLKVLGKGAKERSVPVSSPTAEAITDYLGSRPKGIKYLFASQRSTRLTRYGLDLLIARLAKVAGVPDCYPHRFRHTFAINYLRFGGDAYTLQMILGHSTMDMVKRYLALTDNDVLARHRLASPVENWKFDDAVVAPVHGKEERKPIGKTA